MKTQKNNFWKKFQKPILVMAPMEDVTDIAFREMFSKYSNDNFVYFTEFTSADGLLKADDKGRQKIICRLKKTLLQKPIVAQIFSAEPDNIKKAIIKYINNKGFSGVDINMGCPDKTIIKQGAGSALIKDYKKAQQMVETAKQVSNIPVSVKTRIGFEKIDFDWIAKILQTKPDAITFHLRTTKELSKVPAHWEVLPAIVELKNKITPNTILIANGDMQSKKQAIHFAKKYNVDGVMIGRALFGKPDFFANKVASTPEDKARQLFVHLLFYKTFLGPACKNFNNMKKHFKAYITGFSDAKQLREKLMQTQTPEEAMEILQNFARIKKWQKFMLYTESIVRKTLMK